MSRRGRPPSFSREELIATARELGPEGIGLQQVADALGVSRTSLYWHVRDQDELGELVLAQLVQEAGQGDWSPADDATWEVWLDAFARSLRRNLLASGDWVRYGSGRLFYTRRALRYADRFLAALHRDGFSIEDATHAFYFVAEFVYSNVRSAAGVDMPKDAGRDAFLSSLRRLDDSDVATLRRAVVVMANTPPDRQFEFDLAVAIAGLRAFSDSRRPDPSGRAARR